MNMHFSIICTNHNVLDYKYALIDHVYFSTNLKNQVNEKYMIWFDVIVEVTMN